MAPHLIVAVDDEPTLRDVYAELLHDEGYRVVGCAQADAVACVQREQPDVVLLELWPPAPLGGWAIYQVLAEDPTTATIPVILCTTIRPTAIQPPEELQTSPVAILPKPFGVDDLLGAIQTALALEVAVLVRPS